ncbi:hypothetical protein GCM10009801_66410 [Streptomyces albiaxialis]|uniref:Uncharacterized protein n=1 Tax=Streptomyces albiaxialis TaxID=329523 RepID=A0ABN2WSK5_9ACTN
MVDEDVRSRLREAARAHEPDRARMRARIERGMAAPPAAPVMPVRARRASWPRVVGVAAAVTGVLVAGGYGVASWQHDDARPPSASASGSASASPSAGPPARVPAARLLWADGSIDPGSKTYWSQSEVTVKARKPLTALTVELRLSARGRPEDTGNWRTLPARDFEVSARERPDGGLVYRWTLKKGRTVPAGEHVFAAQYNHAKGPRDANADTYTVRVANGPERAVWRGDFA